jgi:hypothetical protein
MPNWVRNKLFIHGPTESVKQCTLDIASDTEHISFNKIFPRPSDIGDGWYDWSIDHWGTKWDVSDTFEDENGYICFDTAWSTPFELISKLSTLYPNLIFDVQYADEDLGNNCGTYQLQNGLEIYSESYGIEEACQLWGYDYEEMFPEIKRDRNIDRIIEGD